MIIIIKCVIVKASRRFQILPRLCIIATLKMPYTGDQRNEIMEFI